MKTKIIIGVLLVTFILIGIFSGAVNVGYEVEKPNIISYANDKMPKDSTGRITPVQLNLDRLCGGYK